MATSVDCVVEGSNSETLGAVTREWPAEFGADEPGEFPLLMKFLFPREWDRRAQATSHSHSFLAEIR